MDRLGTVELHVVLVGWEGGEQLLGWLVLLWAQDSKVSDNTEGDKDLMDFWLEEQQ